MSTTATLTSAATLSADGSRAGARAALDALPWLGRAIDEDRRAGRFAAWGRSTTIDENTGTAVIPRALFEELHALAGIEAEWPIGNAGLVHCYGYLLSLEQTPYGLKRDRWVDASLARACGFDDDTFHPWTPEATLLTRATRAASAILATPAASAVCDAHGRETHVGFSAARGAAALAYAVAPSPGAAPLLVTLFPVSDAAALRAEFELDPRLRWNAA